MGTKNNSGLKVLVEKPNKEACYPTTWESPKRQSTSPKRDNPNGITTGKTEFSIDW